jgi:hypothetical protein
MIVKTARGELGNIVSVSFKVQYISSLFLKQLRCRYYASKDFKGICKSCRGNIHQSGKECADTGLCPQCDPVVLLHIKFLAHSERIQD